MDDTNKTNAEAAIDGQRNRKTVTKIVKTVIIVLVVAAVVTGAVLGGLYAYASSRAMGEDKAIAIALADAGLAGDKSTVVKCRLGMDEGMSCYKIDLWNNGAEYEYSIHAQTGAVVERETEHENGQGDND
ncbi:MAG: PepSY domain-containing protein [Oscillospiraceae bacterium]